ncbi:diaminopimelate epimerase [Streptomyces sp. B3I7]|uniref:diaminopimelate epimerase n=1 Tax=Streptomyces sp. B3I7 TaxID=3042269 RepID=UPI0027894EFA|nr:diaminopimelate epimerase [Streptomyces sp. B3I7]MDQ0810993.1 diaminopimelate epimerase [Streptomyces sp. B3I7]
MHDFVKYQALGNDYLVVDPLRIDLLGLPSAPTAARLLCDRHRGIGADGVLVGPLGAVRAGEPVVLRTFNPDGSPCGRSANGLRIFALYLSQHRGGGRDVVLRTHAGDTAVRIDDPAAGLVRVDMGRPSFEAADVPAPDLPGPVVDRVLEVSGRRLRVTCLNNGNPHTVVPLPEVSAALARELGPAIAGHPAFPERTNVQFLRVLDRGTVEIEIWERGAGYTLASGAGACAAVSAAHVLGLVDRAVRVRMPGGAVGTTVDPRGAVTLAGVVEQVAAGTLAPMFLDRLGAAA